MAFFRLLLPRLLPEEDRCLYLDSDLVIRHPLTDLFDMDMAGAALAGVTDRLCLEEPHLERLQRDWGIEPGFYVNAGVLLMDLDRMRRGGGAERAEELAYRRAFRYLDQDVLNQVYRGQVLLLPKKYNVFPDDTPADLAFLRRLLPGHAGLFPEESLADPAIVQYIGASKPWVSGGMSFESYWREAEAACASLPGPPEGVS